MNERERQPSDPVDSDCERRASLRDTHYVPDVVPESDLQYFDDGDPRTIGWGDTPAVLVVDMTRAFTEERPDVTRPCIGATATLLESARAGDVPVLYTHPCKPGTFPEDYQQPTIRGGEDTDGDRSEWLAKLTDITAELVPQEGDIVLEKPRASAFFDTHLSSYLHYYGVDTLVVTGMSTSGCVRATVVDGHSSNFRVIVPQECVADRSVISHEIALFDMDMKYADVTPLSQCVENLE